MKRAVSSSPALFVLRAKSKLDGALRGGVGIPPRNLQGHFAHFFMHVAIGGKKNRASERVRRAVKVGDFAASFFNEKDSRSGVPAFEPKFPKAIEAARGDAGEIERGGAIAANAMRTQREIVIVVNVWTGLALVYGKSGAKKTGGESLNLRHGNFCSVERRTFTARGGEEFFINGIVNDADQHLIMVGECDRDTETRVAMGKVGRAVERVHVPAKFGFMILAEAFFGGDGVGRKVF